MSEQLAADLILYLHFLYVLGVVLPIPLILIGAKRNWSWIRNKIFRRVHFSMIFFVVIESLLGIMCPLTVWEEALRRGESAGPAYSQGFISAWISKVMFFTFPPWVFTIQYLLVCLIVVLLYIWIPPRN
ncbi:DUF2784 domain-containing protein [Bdellovibrio bacteriovorus]|uniref:DUF2784 domain-containing protein n=1 Tax=Bdellovibrio bacteriovorus TaxID=959 RepID=UPI0035A990D5